MSSRALRLSACVLAAAVCAAAADRPVLRLSLRRAVEIATSPEGAARIQLADEAAIQAKARFAQARAALLPSLEGAVTQQNQVQNLASFGLRITVPIPGFVFPTIVGPYNLFDARISATQPVLDFSSIRRLQASRFAVRAAKSDRENTGQAVGAQVAKAYLSALKAAADVATAQANVELAGALLRQAESLKSAGTGTGIEVTRQRVQLANERQLLLVAENERRRARLQLLKAMNLRLDTDLELTDRLSYTPVEAAELEDAKANALRSRQDYRAQRERQENARLAAGSVSLERLPSVASFANYGTIGSGVDRAFPTRTYGVTLRVPVFDGGRREARHAEAASQARQERVRAADLKDQIDLDVRLAADELASAADEVTVASEGLALAENELAQARRRVDAGVAIPLEVTDAQTRLSRARDNRTQALFHHEQARIDLGQATGTLERFLR